jgi:hypothetical protein
MKNTDMETIELNGISYVTARDIERCYQLTRKKAWQTMQLAQLEYITLLQSRLYKIEDVRMYFDNNPVVDKRSKAYRAATKLVN